MKKNIFAVVLCSTLFLFGCQNEEINSSKESSTSIVEGSIMSDSKKSNPSITEKDGIVTDTDGSMVKIVPEDRKIYIDENTFMDGTDMYKITQNKDDRKNRESEIVVGDTTFYLMFIFPNPNDDTKEDLWYEEYGEYKE